MDSVTTKGNRFTNRTNMIQNKVKENLLNENQVQKAYQKQLHG